MTTHYEKHYSHALGREMEYKTYGEEGIPFLVFPSQDGRFFNFEDFGMTAALAPFIESGRIRLVCADGIDRETWSDTSSNEHRRIELHERWFRYITDELLPAVRHADGERFFTTGCSMGAFHAANFFFRRPDLFEGTVALSGFYHARYFFPGYTDPLVYDNSPGDFLRGMPADHPYIGIYQQRRIILCVGQGRWEDELLESTREIDATLREKGIPAWVDYWGYDCDHDWPWWRKQIIYFVEKIVNQ